MNLRRIAVLIPFVLSSFAFAQGRVEMNDSRYYSNSNERLAHPLTLHTGLLNYQYEEPGLMKIHGNMLALDGGYRYRLPSPQPMWIGLNGRFAFGSNMTYDGGLQNLKTHESIPVTSGSKDSFNDIRLMYGASVSDSVVSSVDLYGGLGHWGLHNKIQGDGSYGRDITYLYLPVGVEYANKFNPRMTMVLGAEYDMFLSGSATSHMSDISPGAPDIVHNQHSGAGLRLKAGGEFALSGLALSAELFYQAWNIDASDVVTLNIGEGKSASLVEPQNTTSIYGLNIGAKF